MSSPGSEEARLCVSSYITALNSRPRDLHAVLSYLAEDISFSATYPETSRNVNWSKSTEAEKYFSSLPEDFHMDSEIQKIEFFPESGEYHVELAGWMALRAVVSVVGMACILCEGKIRRIQQRQLFSMSCPQCTQQFAISVRALFFYYFFLIVFFHLFVG